ncbi:MAG TPA: hypothetical protein P5274_01525 [Candidatus Paceibacterota bacterium]|nr:hypothetical protein [Candidatus Paceibacterota bacterium]
MKRRKKNLYLDLLLVVISITLAFVLVQVGIVERIVFSLYDLRWLGVFFAGMFFTSIFTVAPASVLLGEFALITKLPILAILGGFGAAFGDYIIFLFACDRMSEDFKYLISSSGSKRFFRIFETKFFKFFVPFIGALVIASPLPDEIGVTMLGLSKVDKRYFILISFIFNSLGILVIGLLARSLLT